MRTCPTADALTAKAVFEVEPARNWRHSVRQVLACSAQAGLPPAAALFGVIRHDALYLKLRGDVQGSNVGPAVALWWWTRTSSTGSPSANRLTLPTLRTRCSEP
jgi:hypothetical protein